MLFSRRFNPRIAIPPTAKIRNVVGQLQSGPLFNWPAQPSEERLFNRMFASAACIVRLIAAGRWVLLPIIAALRPAWPSSTISVVFALSCFPSKTFFLSVDIRDTEVCVFGLRVRVFLPAVVQRRRKRVLFLFCRERYPDCTILIDVGMLIRDHGLGDRSENSEDGVSSLLLRTSACKVHCCCSATFCERKLTCIHSQVFVLKNHGLPLKPKNVAFCLYAVRLKYMCRRKEAFYCSTLCIMEVLLIMRL